MVAPQMCLYLKKSSNENFQNLKIYGDKDYHLRSERGKCWMKWLKNGLGKDFIFDVIIPSH